MKPKIRDYLTIGSALAAILLCGYGIGYRVGEQKGLDHQKKNNHPVEVAGIRKLAWTEETLSRFETALSLTETQSKQIRTEIEMTYDRILARQRMVLLIQSEEIVKLLHQIEPLLTPEQIEKSRKKSSTLRKSLDLRLK